jgi:hypothetical protein
MIVRHSPGSRRLTLGADGHLLLIPDLFNKNHGSAHG